jgi:hypothetical protein
MAQRASCTTLSWGISRESMTRSASA